MNIGRDFIRHGTLTTDTARRAACVVGAVSAA